MENKRTIFDDYLDELRVDESEAALQYSFGNPISPRER